MSENDQDLAGSEQLLVCPYDSSQRSSVAEMENHLIECRGNVGEKAICPLNDKHTISTPEMDYQNVRCPEKPRESDKRRQNGGKFESNLAARSEKSSENFSAETAFSFEPFEATTTGCESGPRFVGGRRNSDSFNRETHHSYADDIRTFSDLESNGEKQETESCLDDSGENYPDQANEEFMSPSRNTAIEKQSDQLESRSSSGNNSSMENVERFDYAKFIPSKDLREDFLKLIGQPRNGQVHVKYHGVNQQSVGTIQQWPPNGYSYHPTMYHTHNGYQSPVVQPGYISFTNTFNVIPTVSPYSGSFGFHGQSPAGPGGFLQTQDHTYDYNFYPPARPSYHRPYFRRRNHYNSYSRYHNSQNDENQTQSEIIDLNQSEESVVENGCYPKKPNGIENHNHETSKCHLTWMQNDCDDTKQWQVSKEVGNRSSKMDNGRRQQQFVYIGEDSEKMKNGDNKSIKQENHCVEENTKKNETDKMIRKIKKKLIEISGLEEKFGRGVKLDCDQLKKLSRRAEFEEQLKSLCLS